MNVEFPGIELVMDGPHVEVLRKNLIDRNFSEEAIERIFDNSAEMLLHCPSAGDTQTEPAVGIMIGKVQSGKTSNFIGLTALALDNQYKMVIVLGGTKNNLVSQNKNRIKQYFEGSKDVLVLACGGEKEDNDPSVLNPVFLNDQFKLKKKVILVTLKRSQNIELVSTSIASCNFGSSPVLIIDDEGDEATPNTLVFQNKQSSTYQSVLNLMQTPRRCAFISVTATPQANFIIDPTDKLSPDFAILIQPGEGYCGLSVFHGDDRKKYCRIISEHDSDMMEDLSNGFPSSFMVAFSMFFVGAAIRRYRGDYDKHAMLIHTSSSVDSHVRIAGAVNNLIMKWDGLVDLKREGIVDDSYLDLDKLFRKAYADYSQTCRSLPSFEELEPYILNAVTNCSKQVLICNGNIDNSKNQQYYENNIFVGGNKLQRGITISGLSITYMTRRAEKKTTVDTVEQRARWFGYRMKHIDVCRIFITQRISEDYRNILTHEEKFWYHISQSLREGYNFKDIPRILTLAGNDLNFTRRNVARTKKLALSEWMIQQKVVLNDESSEYNAKVSEEFFSKHATDVCEWGETKHYVAYCVPIQAIFDEFLDKIIAPDSGNFERQSINLVKSTLIENGVNAFVDVIWMRRDKLQGREILPDGEIKQLMSGSNTNYPGDRYFDVELKHPENIKLQIHFIKPLHLDHEYKPTLALAFRFSNRCLDKVNSNLHIRESDLNGY